MDKTAMLHKCRRLLRVIECEAVTDTSDPNLYDILIRSEEKKTALLTWLIQHLYSPERCSKSSFEDLLSLFFGSSDELKSFLNGTMSASDQFEVWKLMMNTLDQKKRSKCMKTSEDLTEKVLNGTLLDEFEDLLDEKVTKFDCTPLLSAKKREAELQTQLSKAENQLNELGSFSEFTSETFEKLMDSNEDSTLIQKFIDVDKVLNEKMNRLTQSQSMLSKPGTGYVFTEDKLNEGLLKYMRTNLTELQEVMNRSVLQDLK